MCHYCCISRPINTSCFWVMPTASYIMQSKAIWRICAFARLWSSVSDVTGFIAAIAYIYYMHCGKWLCAPCENYFTLYFSWWHIPPSIPLPVPPCFCNNDRTVGGEIRTVIGIGYLLPSWLQFSSLPYHLLAVIQSFSVWRMCFTCAGPAEVIKASAALCLRVNLEARWKAHCGALVQ